MHLEIAEQEIIKQQNKMSENAQKRKNKNSPSKRSNKAKPSHVKKRVVTMVDGPGSARRQRQQPAIYIPDPKADYFKFIQVRHPLERLASAYLNRVKGRGDVLQVRSP